MNNNSDKSVSTSATKSKKPQRKSRQDGYRKKFGNRPHMIIPEADSEFIETQKPSVVKLWLRCWRCDPYGSGWKDLSHDLSPSAFKKAKRILSDKGLFVFEPKKSIRDARETTHWRVLNLHGARKNDFWLKLEDSLESCEAPNEFCEASNKPPKAPNKPSISTQSHTQSASQNPSETPQERLRNSPKEFLKTLPVDPWEDDCDRNTALEGRVTSASPQDEKKMGAACPQTPRGQMGKEITPPSPASTAEGNPSAGNWRSESEKMGMLEKYPDRQPESEVNFSSGDEVSEVDSIPPDVTQKFSNDVLSQEYIPNPHSQDAVIRANAQNLAIEAEQTTEEYQSSSKEFFAQINAIKEELEKKKKLERDRRLRGDSY